MNKFTEDQKNCDMMNEIKKKKEELFLYCFSFRIEERNEFMKEERKNM